MSLLTLPWKLERPTPPFEGDDIRYPEGLVRHFLKKHTKTGDKVFDPFAGLGTTMFVAEELKRIPYGIEADLKRYEWVAGQLDNWQKLSFGDSALLLPKLDMPKIDFCMTSPPYMPRHHKWNPLFAGNPRFAGYDKYLARMAAIFARLKPRMKKGATLVVQVDNLSHGKTFTPLIRDLGTAVSKSFTQTDEITVLWTSPRAGYDQTTCLVFSA